MRTFVTFAAAALFCVGAKAGDLESFNSALAQRDCAQASKILAQSPRAPLLRGISSDVGVCAPKDEARAIEHYREAAQRGDNDGRYSFFVLVGNRNARGESFSQSLWDEAWSYLVAAANARHGSACRVLADSYLYGFEVSKDESRAKHYRACAK